MRLWHFLLAAAGFVVAWYIFEKIDQVAFAYVDGKLFPRKPSQT